MTSRRATACGYGTDTIAKPVSDHLDQDVDGDDDLIIKMIRIMIMMMLVGRAPRP